uniref:Ionotropic receptor 75p3 n=2 Tax=Heortia vitessoides TaxID=1557813 RepID=A0A978W769_9NEOP|nr:ionotropic receptor 75p3 [Heortia vitessoides]
MIVNLIVFFSLNCVLVKSIDSNMFSLLESFLKQDDKPAYVLTPYLCWDKYTLTSMAKSLSASGIFTAHSMQEYRTENYLQHAVIITDLSCEGVKELLIKASDKGEFKSPYRWLLLDLEDDHDQILKELEILVDSDVLVLKKTKNGIYLFTEAYKIAMDYDVIYKKRLTWRPLPSNDNYAEENGEDYTNITTLSDAQTIVDGRDGRGRGVIVDYRESRVLSYRRKNLRNHTLTMVNVITDNNDTRNHMDDRLHLHQDSITKMSYNVVKICFEMLNASEKLVFTHTWGYRDKNGNWQGLVDHLIKKTGDLGTLSIFTKDRMEMIDYIAMVGSTAVRFVFREPPLSYISNIFTMPFTGGVWVAIVVCVLGCSVFLYIASKWEATMSMHQFQLDGSWTDVIILIIGAVLQQGCTLEPRYAAGRTVTLLLFLALTILYAAYSANIVVLLRAPSSSVRTLPDILNSPLKLGASDFEYNRYFFKKLNEPVRKAIYDKKIAPKGKKPNFYTMEEGVAKIRKGLFAFHMELNPGYRLIQETYREDEKCDLVEVDYINEIDPWVPGQKRSPFKDLFKINFIKIREAGIQSCIHHRLHVPKPRCSGTVSTFSSVGITDMYPAMLATLYGMLLAPAVLVMEIMYHRLTVLRKKKHIKRMLTGSLHIHGGRS